MSFTQKAIAYHTEEANRLAYLASNAYEGGDDKGYQALIASKRAHEREIRDLTAYLADMADS